jgi:hypothetical protein
VAAGMLAVGYCVVWLVLCAAGIVWDATHQPATAFLPGALAGTVAVLLGAFGFRAGRAAQIGADYEHLSSGSRGISSLDNSDNCPPGQPVPVQLTATPRS